MDRGRRRVQCRLPGRGDGVDSGEAVLKSIVRKLLSSWAQNDLISKCEHTPGREVWRFAGEDVGCDARSPVPAARA